MDLDDLVPSPAQFGSQSELVIRAGPQAVWEELTSIKMGSLPQTRALEALRYLPLRLVGRGGRPPAATTYLEHLPIPIVSLTPGVSQISAGLSQAWKLLSGRRPPELDARALREWDEPGWIKVAMEFRLRSVPGGTLLTTETRVDATDPRTRSAFGRYWHLIRPASAHIRREVMTNVSKHVSK